MGMFISHQLSRLGPSRNLNGHVYLTPTFLIRTVKESKWESTLHTFPKKEQDILASDH